MNNEEAVRLQRYIMDHALEIMVAKRHDYSGTEDPFRNLRSAEFVGVEAWRGTFVRMMDKISRVRSIMEAGGQMKVRENLIDTFSDMINYICIAAGLVWEKLGLEVPRGSRATAGEIVDALGITEEEMEDARRAIAETERSNDEE